MIEMSELKPRLPIQDDDSVDDESDLIQEDGFVERKKFGRRRRRGKKRRLTLAVLPTLLTLGNGVCGL
ncbi:MAG: CDP-diacylglycerol--serine O-phosphatidyltransferase, partial [Rhodopirellula sp.]|nr:CDP-diacylglycerol--serine O-phosphatidyltransferase [Rhodopirellula sp.]